MLEEVGEGGENVGKNEKGNEKGRGRESCWKERKVGKKEERER